MARLVHAPLFGGRHFADEVITVAVRWYLRFSLSYRDLEELLSERGVTVDHTTVWRWVQRYAPELERRVRHRCTPTGRCWHIDEAYIRAAGEWLYLYRAVDEAGATVDFFLSRERSTRAAKYFLKRALEGPQRPVPREMIVDGNPTYPIAIRALQREGNLSRETRWRCQKKSNNLLEQDHRAVQRPVKAKQNFRSLVGARCTIAGYEAIHMIPERATRFRSLHRYRSTVSDHSPVADPSCLNPGCELCDPIPEVSPPPVCNTTLRSAIISSRSR